MKDNSVTIQTKDKIAVIGTGALGTSLAKVLYDGGKENIIMYGVDAQELEELTKGFNTKYFPNSVDIPCFKTTADLKEALDGAKYVVTAVPSIVMDKVMPQIAGTVNSDVLIINGSKGFYPGTKKSLHSGMSDAAKANKLIRGVVSLIGPSHAEEIILGRPTMVTSVDKKKELCQEVQVLFSNDYFKVYVQTDVDGAEVGAAYKNVLAIASGIANGLGYGINSIAALLTRGLAEMQVFNKAMHGKRDTIYGLTGIGDLIVTATSPLSRNFTLGTNVAKMGAEKALDTKVTVEGVVALKNIKEIAEEKNLELPIIFFLDKVLYHGQKPEDFVKELWNRKFKAE